MDHSFDHSLKTNAMTSTRKITLLLMALTLTLGAYAQSSELTQFWSGGRTDNFLAATQDGKAAAKNAGYITIRSEGYLATQQTSGFVPLYLYYNASTSDNFSSNTTNPPAGYRKIRLQGYIALNPGTGLVPLKVYYSPQRKDYMTLSNASSESAAKGAGYQLKGIVGYVGQTASSMQRQNNSGGMITATEIKTINKIGTPVEQQVGSVGTMQVAKLGDINKLIVNRAMLKKADKVYFSPAESPIFDIEPADKSQAVHIGRGYNSLLQSPKLAALESISEQDIQQLHVNHVSQSSSYVRNLEDYYKHLGVDVKASGSYLFVSGSSRTKFEKNTLSHRFNETYVGHIDMETVLEHTTLENLKLNKTALDVLKNQGINSFYQQYGDCFVLSIQYGAGLRASASYQLHKNEEEVTFSNETKVGAGGLGWSANISSKVDSKTRSYKENEDMYINVDYYGATISLPGSIKEMQQTIKDFAIKADLHAGKSNAQNKFGGVLRYTVMKYSNLPEFQQLAGGMDKLNLVKQRTLLDQLTYHRRKLNRMRSNLLHIQKQPNEFKNEDIKASTVSLAQVDKYLQAIDKDISMVQQFPFDHQRLAAINVMQYLQIPDFAPSSHFVRVEINFPAEQTQLDKQKSYWHDHAGPLIGGNIVNGDGEASGRKIDINTHSNLQIRNNGQEAYLKQDFLLHQNKDDHTKIQYTKSLKVYKAPENYKVVGFKKASEEYFLRDLNAIPPNLPVLFDVNGTMRDDRTHFKNGPINDPLWVDLNVIFDNLDSDQEYVGLFGRMVIYVELQELAPKI
jgi:hypothetical protein